jgi:hypothetical protein
MARQGRIGDKAHCCPLNAKMIGNNDDHRHLRERSALNFMRGGRPACRLEASPARS